LFSDSFDSLPGRGTNPKTKANAIASSGRFRSAGYLPKGWNEKQSRPYGKFGVAHNVHYFGRFRSFETLGTKNKVAFEANFGVLPQ
jgi:hypothetical protein